MRKLIAAAVVIAVGVTAFVGVREYRIEQSRCATIDTLNAATETPIGDGDPVTVVGDSYTHGWGLDDPRQSWVAQLGKTVTVKAASSAGLTQAGLCGTHTLSELAAQVDGPLIIQTGLNDVTATPEALRGAAEVILERHPTAILIGPPSAPAVDRDLLEAVDAALKAAAEATGNQYVSTLGWDLDYSADRLHLTAEGHEQFGQLIAVELD